MVFVKGTDFLLEGGENSLRIAYSGVPADQIDEAVTRLAGAYRDAIGSWSARVEGGRGRWSSPARGTWARCSRTALG